MIYVYLQIPFIGLDHTIQLSNFENFTLTSINAKNKNPNKIEKPNVKITFDFLAGFIGE